MFFKVTLKESGDNFPSRKITLIVGIGCQKFENCHRVLKNAVRVHDWHNDGVFIKATKSLKIVVLTCYLSHSPKIHR